VAHDNARQQARRYPLWNPPARIDNATKLIGTTGFPTPLTTYHAVKATLSDVRDVQAHTAACMTTGRRFASATVFIKSEAWDKKKTRKYSGLLAD